MGNQNSFQIIQSHCFKLASPVLSNLLFWITQIRRNALNVSCLQYIALNTLFMDFVFWQLNAMVNLAKWVLCEAHQWIFSTNTISSLFSFLNKWANPGPFLFIFVLFKFNFTEKLYTSDSNSDHRTRRQASWPLDHHHHQKSLFS